MPLQNRVTPFGEPVAHPARGLLMGNRGGRLGSFDRLERSLAPGTAWSSFDRAIGGGAYFGSSGTSAAPITAEDRRSAA